MRIDDLRIGNYVDVVDANGAKTRCELFKINKEENFAVFKDMTKTSEFVVDTAEIWNFVKDIPTTAEQLVKLGFKFEVKPVFMFPDNGAWFNGSVIVQKYQGVYDLLVADALAFYGCKAIAVPSIHLLQNAIYDTFGIKLHY